MPNQYDFTKKMLKTLRDISNTQRLIKEQESETDIAVINDVEVKMNSTDENDMTLTDDQKNSLSQIIDNFRQQVNQIVDFEPGFTLSEKQIRLDGTLTDEEIIFALIAGEDDGVYINANMIELTDDVIDIIQKLKKFIDIFKTTCEPIINQRNTNI